MTYSIVARDPDTGRLGVAVQSHWFGVGAVVPWARPGIGAVATQANLEIAYGPRLLDLLADGADPQSALERLLEEDPAGHTRQVAVVDAQGRVAVHTGTSCTTFAGHAVGDGFTCQANIMATERVWGEMRDTFASSTGVLSERLLDALDAAERAGGDLRGRQSAALLVVPGEGEAWRTEVRLHVEDEPEPLSELRRLLAISAAYRLASRADDLAGLGRHREAADAYRQAHELDPDNHELRFWAGLGAAEVGDFDLALQQVRAAIAAHPPWREMLDRLSPDISPSAPEVRARLRDEGVA
jgi:uncharacterized Ntn-hydrolase superfamily protein